MRTKRITNLNEATTASAIADYLTSEGYTALWLNSFRSGGLEVVTDAPRSAIEHACLAFGVSL